MLKLALFSWLGVSAISVAFPLNERCRSLIALVAENPGRFEIVEHLAQQLEADLDAEPALHRLAEVIRGRSEALRGTSNVNGKDIPMSETESRLILRYGDDIVQAIVPKRLRDVAIFRIREGYISEVELSLTHFLSHGQQIFAAFPIKHLRVTSQFPTGGKALWASFFESRLLAQLTSLSIINIEIGKRVEHLINSPHLENLRSKTPLKA